MWTMLSLFERIRRCEAGATAIEYALLAALIAVVLVGSVTLLGGELSETFVGVEADFEAINSAGAAPPAD